MVRRAKMWGGGALLLAITSVAHASPSYSRTLEETLALPCGPSCLVCHTTEAGGFATANTRLGITLRRKFYAECCDDDALVRIIADLEAAGVDSDGDGTPDVSELRAGTDPNSPEASAVVECEPEHDSGCTLRRASAARPVYELSWVVALAALVLARRSARRS